MMPRVLGGHFVRPDAMEKVTGSGVYTADMVLPGLLHGAFLYGQQSHARIRRLDVTGARAIPGVVAVLAQEDVPDVRYGLIVRDRTLFADRVVRFEGEIVAAVAALTPELASEALAAIDVVYEPLNPILDVEAALAEDSLLVHEEWAQYDAPSLSDLPRHGNDCGYSNIVKGDLDRGFMDAEVIVEERYVADMSHGVAIEPHAILAQWHGERVTIWSASQVPFAAQAGVAQALRVPLRNVRIVVPLLGGGFGSKCEFHFEAHVAALARAAGRPVRLVLDRREEFTAIDMVRHAIITDVKTGLRRDGTIVARQIRHILDTGAYAAHGPVQSQIATMMGAGPYRIPNLFVEARAVYSNRTPAGSVRAPTGPQICWAIEQHTDVCAQYVGVDPIDFRLKNLADEGDQGPTGQHLTAVGSKECLERAAELVNVGQELPEGEGVGVAVGWWPSFPSASAAHLQLNLDGSATIVTGAQENGSGAVMALALFAAEELGMEPQQVRILHQDTDAAPYDMGSSGSQTTFNNGRAVVAAAGQIRERLLELASEELEIDPADLELSDGAARAKGAPSRCVLISDLVEKAMLRGQLFTASASPSPPPMPVNSASTCVGRTWFPAFQAPTFFAHAVRVRVDQETGVVRVLDAAAAHDFGRVINPLGVEGQVEGGFAHGLGMALLEGTQYSTDGRQQNPNLLDYKLQTAADVPALKIVFVERPAPDGGPHGIKGVGEPPVIPTAGAIANAIAAATGARVHHLPMTPMRVWNALQGTG